MKFVSAMFIGFVVAQSVFTAASAQDAPGVTDKEIKIGGLFPLSGPASNFGKAGVTQMGYMKSINDRGGINGRNINYVVLDDAYSPPKAVEQMRRLVEGEGVAFVHAQLGTPAIAATIKYINQKKVPQTFISSGASVFSDFKAYPYTTTGVPSYASEAKVFARYVEENFPAAKVAILYQNDDLGRDYVNGFKAIFGDRFSQRVVTASFEVNDPTVDSQIVNLKSSNADVLVLGSSPKASAQAIRKTRELGWKTEILLSQVSSTISGTLEPAGKDNSKGVISSAYVKDPSDPKYADDPEVKEYFAFMSKYVPSLDPRDDVCAKGYINAAFLEEMLKRAGNDLSRENLRKVSRSMPQKHYPMMLEGTTAGTDENNSQMLTKLQLQRFNGTGWDLIGSVISAD